MPGCKYELRVCTPRVSVRAIARARASPKRPTRARQSHPAQRQCRTYALTTLRAHHCGWGAHGLYKRAARRRCGAHNASHAQNLLSVLRGVQALTRLSPSTRHAKIARGGRLARNCAPHCLLRPWRAQWLECVHHLCARAPCPSVFMIMCASRCLLARTTLPWLRRVSAARLNNAPSTSRGAQQPQTFRACFIRTRSAREALTFGARFCHGDDMSKQIARAHPSLETAILRTRGPDTHCCNGCESCA